MPASLPPVKIISKTSIDIYAETSISMGKRLVIQNTGPHEVKLTENATAPDVNVGYVIVPPNGWIASGPNPVGLWAYAQRGGRLQVEELTNAFLPPGI